MTFDIRHLDKSPAIRNAVVKASDESYDPEVSAKKTPAKDWELDVKSLISSKKWLQNYGLKKNRLTFFQILPVIGFKHSDGTCICLLNNSLTCFVDIIYLCTRRIAIADQLMNWIVKCKNLAIILKWPNMHETDCKMLDIDSDTNFIHFLLQEGIMKSVLMDWFYGNSGRQWYTKMCLLD